MKTIPDDLIVPKPKDVSLPITGLTKREYFAAMAMQGILSCQQGDFPSDLIAKSAIVCADALIKELNNQ
jgi:hypothetical protein